MTVVDGAGYDGSAAAPAVVLEVDAGVARIVVGGVFSAAAAAMARELLVDACDRATVGVVLVVEATVDAAHRDELCHLVDVAQRRCWAASCRLEVAALHPEACDALVTAGIWPSALSPENADRTQG